MSKAYYTRKYTSKVSAERKMEATMTTGGQRKKSFLHLPAELRVLIYDHIIRDMMRQSRQDYMRFRSMPALHCTLLLVNEQIHDEFVRHFREQYLGLPCTVRTLA